jgi:hypothetical protein
VQGKPENNSTIDTPEATQTEIPQPSLETTTQTPIKSTKLFKAKKWLKTKIPFILIIIISLIVIVVGYRSYKTFKVKEQRETKRLLESAPEPKFGYMAHHVEWQQLADYRERWSYLSWERTHPGYANWQEIEPKKGEYNWERIDQYVRTAQEKNIQTLFTIWPFTDWDQEACNQHIEWHPNDGGKDWGKYGKGKDFLPLAHRKGRPCDMEAYREFLRLLVERYDGDGEGDVSSLRYPIRYWEIGNEPGIAYDFFQGTTEDYFEILKTSYVTIKETDPNAKILIAAMPSPGNVGQYDTPEFDTIDLFELGAANYFDISNSHGLGGHKMMREFLTKYGAGDKPIWVTEAGGVKKQFPELLEKEDELALALAKHFTEESNYGATMFFVGGGKDLDPALYKAINIIAQEFKDSSICKKISDDEKRAECYTFFAVKTKDIAVCEKIIERKLRDDCLWELQ